jgi:hypothetical protein
MLTGPLVLALALVGSSALAAVPASAAGAAAPTATTPPVPTLTGLTTAQVGTSATTPSAGLITASTGGVPVTISWRCQPDPSLSGIVFTCNSIDHYVLQESVNGATFTPVALPSPTATSVTLSLRPSPTNNSTPATTYTFEVQAVDTAGNASGFAVGSTFAVPDTDNSFQSSFSGSWSGVNLVGAFGGSVHQSSTSGAAANPANAAPATSLAWVSTLGPDRGQAHVKIDGQVMATVDLYAPTQTMAQVVWTINGLAPGVTHTIQIVALGTQNAAASAAKVDYDAILALK